MGKFNKIRRVGQIKQTLRRFCKSAASLSHGGRVVPSDVPAGHVAISVGSGCRRFVVRATYLNHPVFKELLSQAEEEYGFTNNGPLLIPCKESDFVAILQIVSQSESSNSVGLDDFLRCWQVGYGKSGYILGDSQRLLHA